MFGNFDNNQRLPGIIVCYRISSSLPSILCCGGLTSSLNMTAALFGGNVVDKWSGEDFTLEDGVGGGPNSGIDQILNPFSSAVAKVTEPACCRGHQAKQRRLLVTTWAWIRCTGRFNLRSHICMFPSTDAVNYVIQIRGITTYVPGSIQTIISSFSPAK